MCCRTRSGAPSPGWLMVAECRSSGRRSSVLRWLGRPLAVVVVDGVAAAEQLAQPAAVGQALESPELARVGVDHEIGLAVGAEREEAHGLGRAVDELMPAVLAAQERDHLALTQVAPPVVRAQAG